MDEKTLRKHTDETPLGWKVNLLNMLCSSLMALAENIDSDLRKIKMPDGSTLLLKHKKKRDYNQMCEYLKEGVAQYQTALGKAAEKYNDLNIDGQVWRIVGANTARYDNFTADAKELLQMMMLYIDRAHSDTGYYSILRHLRSLPSGDIFPEEEIARFHFKRPLVPCPGAPIRCRFGKGVIRDQMNGDNWLIDMEDGTQRVLTSTQYEIDA